MALGTFSTGYKPAMPYKETHPIKETTNISTKFRHFHKHDHDYLAAKMFQSISAVLIDVRLEAGICHRCAAALPASVTNMPSCVRKYARAYAYVSMCVSQIGICVLGSSGTLLRRRVRQVMHRDNQSEKAVNR